MREFHHERFEQKHDYGDDWQLDTAWLTPADFLREEGERFSPQTPRDETMALLKAKFDYISNIMNDTNVPGVQRMIERFLKTAPKKGA